MQQYFTEKALTLDEAERKAREKYGERLTILRHETVKIPSGPFKLFSTEGVQIMGIVPQGRLQEQPRNRAVYSGEVRPRPDSAWDSAQGAAQSAAYSAARDTAQSAARSAAQNAARDAAQFAGEKEKLLALAGKDNTIKEVLAEVRELKEKLESQGLAGSQEKHPTLSRIDDILILNDFPLSYRKAILERARKELSIDGLSNYNAVQDKVLEWIGEGIKIHETGKFQVRPTIFVLVGPTGVGKTTTIAKLAANFGINEKGRHKRNITLITIDAYRIGAWEQIETYGEALEFPFFLVTDYDELRKTIAVNSEKTDLFLIDTIGMNPRDLVQMGEMKRILDACGTLAEFHLAVAATTKASDLLEILKTFEPFNYRSVIVTKIDETRRTGNVIGTLYEKAKSVSYITNGQTVPTNILKASVVQFLINLEGFKVNRIKLEEKFPDSGRDQMQLWR